MKNLFISEFQRLYHKKSTRACFLAIPILLIASAKYYLGINSIMEVSNPQYTSFWNFPVAAMQEVLLLGINMVVILIIVLCVTQEVRDGSIRMVLIRRFKLLEVVLAKFLVVMVSVFIYLLVYLLIGYIIGYFTFSKIDNVAIFYWSKAFNSNELILYTLKYYLFAYLTLVGVGTVVFFISIISKSIIIALGTSLATLLGLIAYPIVIQMLLFNNINLIKFQMLSITQIQYEGIAMVLGEKNILGIYPLLIVVIYIVVFLVSSYYILRKEDNLI